jgi:Yip1 domain
MISHVAGLFTHPQQEWQEIRDTKETLFGLYFGHVLLLALIPAVSLYVGMAKVGWKFGAGDPVMLTDASAITMSVLLYFALLVGVGILGAFIDWMSRTFDAKPGLVRCIAFSAYALTPVFISGLCLIYPNVILAMLVGLIAISYTVYLLYSGIPIFMNIPKDEGFIYASSVLTVGLVMFVALLAATVLAWSFGIGPVYAG